MSFSKEFDFKSDPRLVKIDQHSKGYYFRNRTRARWCHSRRIKFSIVDVGEPHSLGRILVGQGRLSDEIFHPPRHELGRLLGAVAVLSRLK